MTLAEGQLPDPLACSIRATNRQPQILRYTLDFTTNFRSAPPKHPEGFLDRLTDFLNRQTLGNSTNRDSFSVRNEDRRFSENLDTKPDRAVVSNVDCSDSAWKGLSA